MPVLHTIKAWLYKNLLEGNKNKYTALVKAERSLSVRDICASAVKRGGTDAGASDMEYAVDAFLKEMAYLLCDGFSVNTGWYNASIHIRGVFTSPDEPFDPAKHSIAVVFHQGKDMRKELIGVNVDIAGEAGAGFFITGVVDLRTGSVNGMITPGRNAAISGGKVKVQGDDPSCGVYFVNAADRARVKVDAADLVENQYNRLLIITPPLPAGTYHVEVTTQYTGGSNILKAPRTAVFDRLLTVT